VLPDGEQLGDVLPMDLEPFNDTELRAVLRKLKLGKASGEDGILPEHLKALLFNEEARLELLSLINSCWRAKDIPSDWRCSQVVAIFKKGDQSDPGNYRPISLLNISYKVLASLLLNRLKIAGAESRIRRTQFGFKSKAGTSHAIFLGRRLIDASLSLADGRLMLLLLDWRKAFDRVCPKAMIVALRRFGLP